MYPTLICSIIAYLFLFVWIAILAFDLKVLMVAIISLIILVVFLFCC